MISGPARGQDGQGQLRGGEDHHLLKQVEAALTVVDGRTNTARAKPRSMRGQWLAIWVVLVIA
jgi:hypothetical protein